MGWVQNNFDQLFLNFDLSDGGPLEILTVTSIAAYGSASGEYNDKNIHQSLLNSVGTILGNYYSYDLEDIKKLPDLEFLPANSEELLARVSRLNLNTQNPMFSTNTSLVADYTLESQISLGENGYDHTSISLVKSGSYIIVICETTQGL